MRNILLPKAAETAAPIIRPVESYGRIGASTWLSVLAVCMCGVIVFTYFPNTVDDAFIVARYAENLVNTGNLVFNRNEFVSALTSPLHALMEAWLYRLTGNTIFSYKVVSLILLAISVIAIDDMVKDKSTCRLINLVLIIVSPCVIFWTLGGLETPLLLFLVTVFALLSTHPSISSGRTLTLLHGLAGMLFLVRYDTVVFTLPVLAILVVRSQARGTHFRAVFLAMLLPLTWLVFAAVYYGDIFPTSFYVKVPSWSLPLVINNGSYILQFLFLTGILPLAGFLSLSLRSKLRRVQPRLLAQEPLFLLALGLAGALTYGLSVATIHMMFAFRIFVPYIPVVAIICSALARSRLSGLHDSKQALHFERQLLLVSVVVLFLHGFMAWYMYTSSLNPIIVGVGELRRTGVAESIGIMAGPPRVAEDIRQHWQGVNVSRDRQARIYTYAAGMMPYTYSDSYIFEQLVSYRHDCHYDLRRSADYIDTLVPWFGPIDKQLPGGVTHYQRIVSHTLVYENDNQVYAIYYNPKPESNMLPATVFGGCQPIAFVANVDRGN